MPIQMFDTPELHCYEQAVQNLKLCCSEIDEYLDAMKRKDTKKQHSVKRKISAFVPSGVYKRACSETNELLVVFGVERGLRGTVRESAFFVKFAPLKDEAQKTNKPLVKRLMSVSLVDTEGFLMPVVQDAYRGPRYIRVGEVIA